MVAPSILACDFTRLRDEIEAVDRCGIDLIHLDIMDGSFVPNLTFGQVLVEAVRRLTRTPLDAHLMIDRPERHLQSFVESGADYIVFHLEATERPDYCIDEIRRLKTRPGIALRPKTRLEEIKPYLKKIDLLLLMSVEPGFSGQEFIPDTLAKIREAKELVLKEENRCIIGVDGGVNTENAQKIIEHGADLLIAASAIFKSDDYCRVIETLRCSSR